MRTAKITWDKIYKEFRKTHPEIAKEVLGFQPYDYATILVYLKDNKKISFNYDTKKVDFLPKYPK